jgi:AraC family transcriptional regulator of adaptative response/methylated-DNA-[protein]-cysteine methyltransferase
VIIRYSVVKSFIGKLVIAENDKGICAILFGADIKELNSIYPKAELIKTPVEKCLYINNAISFIEEPQNKLNIPLYYEGTEFQKKVWKALLNVKLGKVVTYQDIACAIGKPKAVRAVANACGANRIPVLIPCHRIIRTDGTIGGYGGGVEIKRKLLACEGIKL